MLTTTKGDEISGDREFVNAALVCLRHCFVSGKKPPLSTPTPPVSNHLYRLTASYSSAIGKFVSTQRGNYYGLGGGDPCYWRDEVTAFRTIYDNKKSEDVAEPGTLATFLELEKDKVRVQMDTAVKMCEFERQGITLFSFPIPSLPPTSPRSPPF